MARSSMVTASRDLRWAEDSSEPSLTWREDVQPSVHYQTKCSSCGDMIEQCRCMGPHEIRYAVCDACKGRTAVRNAPSKPYLTDEYAPTDAKLWERCLEVVNGERREYTQSGRTIHSPNRGRGYEHMPNPKGMAWAVKQYNGFGGGWKPRKSKEAAEVPHAAALRILAHGGIVVARPGELEGLKREGLARVAGEAHGRVYWDSTPRGRRKARTLLGE